MSPDPALSKSRQNFPLLQCYYIRRIVIYIFIALYRPKLVNEKMCIRCISHLKNRSFPGLRGSLCSPKQRESRQKEENASRKIKGWLDSRQCVCVCVSGM